MKPMPRELPERLSPERHRASFLLRRGRDLGERTPFALPLAALLAAATGGCATGGAGDGPERAQAQLMALPGGMEPVNSYCEEQAEFSVRQLPIQLRAELAQETAGATFAACVEVLTVLVSVAMREGDSTEDGLAALRGELGAQDVQILVDACDIHYRSWRLLQGERRPLFAPARDSMLETARYEGWVDRCFSVLRLLVNEPPSAPDPGSPGPGH